MSNPERLVFERVGITEEICVAPHVDDMDAPRPVGVPRERDIAQVLAGVSNEWFEGFLRAFQKSSPNRAMVVARVAESAQLKPDLAHEKALSDLASAFGISQEDLIGAVHGVGWQLLPAARAVLALSTDVTGGDCDPGFGVDPNDSARLLQLRQAIDSYLGWKNQADEDRGDYVARVREVGDALVPAGTQSPDEQLVSCLELNNALSSDVRHLVAKVKTLVERNLRQRRELRRFNREARARREAIVPLHVTRDRWFQKLHTLEQKTALGTATQADCFAIERLRRWLGDYP